ncbi:TetR/AcrR family transcriptional regulator [Pseudarthrobacter sp. N5]|uniref:TetR/AcrR family transcriptional regulator n=1 Tax=Pseudarthrobacter sp. N5 TaxID=3418416 RepID=UPI003CEABA19
MHTPAFLPDGPPSATPSRRELNKAATRQAITDAALELLRGKGPGNFTVEDIADTAGICRRTFFNYFSSTEAAIASVTHGFLDNALVQFRLRPANEPILESARAALVELADPMTMAPMGELFSLTQANPQLSRSELEAWDHCTEQIIDAARERAARTPGVVINELYLRALAGSVISCGKAAMDVWFARCGADLSEKSLAVLRQLLIDSMGLLGSGFAGPAGPASPATPSTAAAPSSPAPTVASAPLITDRH